MKTLPAEFRHRVVALTDDGMTTGEIAEALGTSAPWVRSIKALHKAGQPLEPKSRANRRESLAEREGDRLRAQVAAKPGSTLEDLKRDLGLDTTIPNLWLALRQLKVSLKKTRPAILTGSRVVDWLRFGRPRRASHGQDGQDRRADHHP